MKIACFTESLAAGGAQRQLVNLALLFRANGHTVDFVTYRKEDFFLDLLEKAEIPVHQIENASSLQRLLRVRRYFKKSRPDILLSFLETPNFIACFSSLGKHPWKLITTELSAKERTFHGKRSKLFLWFQRFSDAIVCNSFRAEEMWKRYCPQYAGKICTIYNPVVANAPTAHRPANEAWKRTVVVPASFQYLKNPIGLIEAVHKLPEEKRERLTIRWFGKIEPQRGNTAAYDEAESLVQAYGLGETVFLSKETPDIFREIERADAVGLFSTVEGLPNAICEGMFFRKPILMSRVSDYEVFASAGGVILCQAESVETIRDALSAFLELDEQTLAEMGQRNGELARELFSPAKIVGEWEDLFCKETAQ